ncbi:BamA/TamA family outer membrane protein [Puniceicoccaceae bacterium K14]|nr:BamA/TamA family outer membrane protein [Puniceicoccaceae bacterium K14]
MKLLSIIAISLAVAAGGASQAIAEQNVKPAAWKVKGQGLIKNFALKRQLNNVFNEEKEFFEAVDIEDAALILLSNLQAQGFLDAEAEATIERVDGTVETVVWDKSFSVVLPRDTKAQKVSFKLMPGKISYFKEIVVVSNNSRLEQEDIEAFFYSEGLLLQGDDSQTFTNSLMTTGASNIAALLKQEGYQDAVVEAKLTPESEGELAKHVSLSIDKGPLYVVREVLLNVTSESFEPELELDDVLDKPYSRFVSQDIMKSLRNQFYAKGYPDVEVSATRSEGVDVSLVFEVVPGEPRVVGEISFAGAKETKQRLLRSRLELEEGDPYNPILLESSRLKVSRIGVFGRVDYETEEVSESESNIEFQLQEKTPWKLDVLAGWGSYELLRAGLTAERMNVWGLGHSLRFRSVVSLKSALGEWRYLYPDVFNSNASLSATAFALERDENVYTLEQIGFDLGLSKRLEFLDVDTDLVYTFESVKTLESELGSEIESEDDSLVGSVGLRVGRDRRDNPINPRSGYRATSSFEWAAEALGGEADYQLAELAYSQHGDVGRGLYWHGGISVGVIGTLSESESQVPTGKLFYQGGENSIRGYKRGDASPINNEGLFEGARSYTLVNVELEQLLTESLSVVLFYDGLAQTQEAGASPFDEYLSSVGLGLRFKTFMGPVRFEYGHNLNRREVDSPGTFHFSIGYPF